MTLWPVWKPKTRSEIDQTMIDLDGTENKRQARRQRHFGSFAGGCQAQAEEAGLPLYRYLGGTMASTLPVPMMNIVNGGQHADNPIDIPGIHDYAGRCRLD